MRKLIMGSGQDEEKENDSRDSVIYKNRHPISASVCCDRKNMAPSQLYLLVILMAVGTRAGMLEFGQMVQYMTGRPPLKSYIFYGCYCGLGGRGWPVDEIDWCCHRHDCCYGALSQTGCFPLYEPYIFSRVAENITCDDQDLHGCARRSCECDRAASLCFQTFDHRYSRNHSKNMLRKGCEGPQPPCEHCGNQLSV